MTHAIKVESLTVHDANGQPYELADAIFDVEGVKKLVAENAALANDALDPLVAAAHIALRDHNAKEAAP